MRRPALTWVVGILVLASGLAQVVLVWRNHVSLSVLEIVASVNYPARDRAGVLSIEYDPADIEFFQFLREKIPTDGRLLIPPRDDGRRGEYRYRELLEYHLFPVEIVHCSRLARCLASADPASSYVLSVRGYPGAGWTRDQTSHTLVPFSESLGVYVPKVVEPEG